MESPVEEIMASLIAQLLREPRLTKLEASHSTGDIVVYRVGTQVIRADLKLRP